MPRLTPFLYPKKRHVRTQAPPHYSNYRRYKPYLRAEFAYKCVYCRTPDGIKGIDNFGADHYRPSSLFPQDLANYANLFYACNTCNRRKRDFWPSRRQLELGIYVPNPCDFRMFEHLRFEGPWVRSRTPAGAYSVDLMMLNESEAVGFREVVNAAIAEIETVLRRQLKTRTALLRKLKRAGSNEEKARVEEKVSELDSAVEKSRGYLSRLTGSPAARSE